MPGEAFKALADLTRRRILELLRGGDKTAGDIAEQPSSHHAEKRRTRRGPTRRPKHHLQSQHHRLPGHHGLVLLVHQRERI